MRACADLRLRAHQALRHRRRRHQERARDLLRLEAAQRAQRQRDLRLDGQRRVAAGEDEAQPIVTHGHLVDLAARVVAPERGVGLHLGALVLEQRAPPHLIDRLVARGADQPGARVRGRPLARPLHQRRLQRRRQRLFAQVDVAQDADQRREDPPPLLLEDAARPLRDWDCTAPELIARAPRVIDDLAQPANTRTGRTSIVPLFADGTRAAILVASSRSFASIR